MTIVLHLWQRMWQSVSFDTARGQGKIRWFSRAPSRGMGWATKHQGTWFALWSDGNHVIFQAGARILPMTDDCRCRDVRSGETRTFLIQEHGVVVFELTYAAMDRDADLTFDLLDLEQEDFFFFTSQLWADPKRRSRFVQKWSGA